MGLIQAKWEQEECRIENGIYFSDDSFIQLAGSATEGYQAAIRQSLEALMEKNVNGWAYIDPTSSAEDQSLSIVGGGGSYEGEGFLAVMAVDTGRLIWLLHLTDAERFTEIRIDGSLIRAISDEYPFRYAWTIPVESPHALVVTAHKQI